MEDNYSIYLTLDLSTWRTRERSGHAVWV